MASTRLVRKARRNRVVSRQRVNTIKRLTSKPVIKKVDVEQIKEEFASQKAKPVAKKEEPVKETPAVEPKAEKKEAAPAAPKDTGKKTEKEPKAKVTSAEVKEEAPESSSEKIRIQKGTSSKS